MLSLIDYINHSNTSQFTEGVNFLGDTRLFFFQTGKTISCIKHWTVFGISRWDGFLGDE